MEYELKTFIVDRLQQTVVTPITKLTTGIEHEFFLMQPDGAPAGITMCEQQNPPPDASMGITTLRDSRSNWLTSENI